MNAKKSQFESKNKVQMRDQYQYSVSVGFQKKDIVLGNFLFGGIFEYL